MIAAVVAAFGLATLGAQLLSSSLISMLPSVVLSLLEPLLLAEQESAGTTLARLSTAQCSRHLVSPAARISAAEFPDSSTANSVPLLLEEEEESEPTDCSWTRHYRTFAASAVGSDYLALGPLQSVIMSIIMLAFRFELQITAAAPGIKSTYIILKDVHEVHADRLRRLHDMLVGALPDLSDRACETRALQI